MNQFVCHGLSFNCLVMYFTFEYIMYCLVTKVITKVVSSIVQCVNSQLNI